MQTIQSLFNNIDSFTQMTTSTTSQYVDLSIAYNKITNYMATIANYRDGILNDSNPI
jgi:hypothetical protein